MVTDGAGTGSTSSWDLWIPSHCFWRGILLDWKAENHIQLLWTWIILPTCACCAGSVFGRESFILLLAANCYFEYVSFFYYILSCFLFRQVPTSSFILLNKATPTKQRSANEWFLSSALKGPAIQCRVCQTAPRSSQGSGTVPRSMIQLHGCDCADLQWQQRLCDHRCSFTHYSFFILLRLIYMITCPLWSWNAPKRLRLSTSHSLTRELDLC